MTNYPLTYIRLLTRMLRLNAQQQAQLFANTALSPASMGQLGGTISEADTLIVLSNLAQLSEQKHLGLTMVDRLSLASHGPLGQLLSAGPCLSDAWYMLEKYHVLRLPFITIRCHQNDEEFIFKLNFVSEISDIWVKQFLLESVVVTIQRSVELVLGRRLKESRIALQLLEPADLEPVAKYLSGEIMYTKLDSKFVVPLSIMQKANPYNDPLLWEQASKLCAKLHEPSQQGFLSMEHSIRQLLQAQTGRLWSLGEVAEHYHISQRTMIRRLKAEGTRYQTIVDTELEKQAKIYLQTPGQTIDSVAYAIGYNDTSAFRRAFHRWCGMSPRQWQKMLTH